MKNRISSLALLCGVLLLGGCSEDFGEVVELEVHLRLLDDETGKGIPGRAIRIRQLTDVGVGRMSTYRPVAEFVSDENGEINGRVWVSNLLDVNRQFSCELVSPGLEALSIDPEEYRKNPRVEITFRLRSCTT